MHPYLDPQGLATRRDLMVRDCSNRFNDRLTDTALEVIAEDGLAGLTISAIAARQRVSRQAVQQWLHGVDPTTRACAVFLDRWAAWGAARTGVRPGEPSAGLLGLLPECEEVVRWTRVWLAFGEAATRHPALGEIVASGLAEEQALIARHVRPADPGPLHALIIGLRHLRCAEPAAISAEEAETLLLSAAPARTAA